MASLQQLLAKEGFQRRSSSSKKTKQGSFRYAVDDPVSNFNPPMYICHRQKSVVRPNKTTENSSSRTRRASIDTAAGCREPAMDQIAVKAIVSILSGYIGRYTRDAGFRERIREKCNSCLVGASDDTTLTNMELAVDNVDELVQNRATMEKKEKLRNSIQFLTTVSSSLDSQKLREGSIPDSHLSSCAQLYLSIVHKLEKDDKISAIHLLQCFCDAPFLARTHLLLDLWDHFFLPHLLHLRVWYHEELQLLSGSQSSENSLKSLCRVYNQSMDMGTLQFALYYKDWLKFGVKSPSVPEVPLPSSKPRRRSSMDSSDSQLSSNRNLFEYVFGRTPSGQWNSEEKKVLPPADNDDVGNFVVSKRRAGSGLRTTHDYSWSEITPPAVSGGLQKPESLKFFSCRSVVAECVAAADANLIPKNNLSSRKNSLDNSHLHLSPLRRWIDEICTSDVLSDCEAAIHEITKLWLSSGGDPLIEEALSKQPVIESMVEILYASQDDEILELVISLLAELASRSNRTRAAILNYDPQLEIFIKLLKSSSLFLKAATLLYQLKPLAKQMISTEWVALVLRVLEFGDQLQVLFSVVCNPREAALYLLEQLMMGFDEDKNLENSSEVVSLGGLSLLARRFDVSSGGVKERDEIAMLLCSCVKAVGCCRDYLAENLSKGFLLRLIALGIRKKKQGKKEGFAFKLLTELLCLGRRREIIKLLIQINQGFDDDGLNAKHVFLAYLQRASTADRPLVAALLLQLDLLEGHPTNHSVYREEAIEALTECLDCERSDSEAQEQTARALLMMGGSFSHDATATTTTTTEEWLFRGRLDEFMDDGSDLSEEEEATVEWRRKMAVVLLNSGGQRLLMALSSAIANGTPNLARTCLFTVSWMNQMFRSFGDRKLIPLAQSVLLSQLTDERSPSSLQNQECVSMLWRLKKQYQEQHEEQNVM